MAQTIILTDPAQRKLAHDMIDSAPDRAVIQITEARGRNSAGWDFAAEYIAEHDARVAAEKSVFELLRIIEGICGSDSPAHALAQSVIPDAILAGSPHSSHIGFVEFRGVIS